MAELKAWAYFNGGRWVVDCPAHCGNAWEVKQGTKHFTCYVPVQRIPGRPPTEEVGCGTDFGIEWPPDPTAAARTPAPGSKPKTAAQLRYEAEAQREHEAQHTDHEDEPGDGQEKSNRRGAARLRKMTEQSNG